MVSGATDRSTGYVLCAALVTAGSESPHLNILERLVKDRSEGSSSNYFGIIILLCV